MDERQATAWLSAARFAPFLASADGDIARAVALYEWHADLSAALFSMIRGVEVMLRNTVDRELGAGQPQSPLHRTWLFDLGVLRPAAVKQVVVAVERLGRIEPTRDAVIAMLPLGFWAMLFGRRYDGVWQQGLHRAFPFGTVSREGVGRAVDRLQRLRNRVAHHDSLLAVDVRGAFDDALLLAGWIDPAAARWLRRQVRVDAVLARRP